MSFPSQAVAPNSGLTLGTIITLMQIAADGNETHVAVQISPELHSYLGTNPEPFEPLTGRRKMRVNELCKEALPYMKRIYEIEDARKDAEQQRDSADKARQRAEEETKRLADLLMNYAPHLFVADD